MCMIIAVSPKECHGVSGKQGDVGSNLTVSRPAPRFYRSNGMKKGKETMSLSFFR
jgi:hypothetical protein